MTTINMLDVTRGLMAEGIDTELWNTGGGVMCIYAGPKRVDPNGETRFAALCGPGRWDREADTPVFDLHEIYLGTDDEGDTDPVDLHALGVSQVSQIVRAIIAQTKVPAGMVLSATAVEEAIR